MITSRSHSCCCLLFTLLTVSFFSQICYAVESTTPPQKSEDTKQKAETDVQNSLELLLSAIEDNDYAAFSLAVDDTMKAAMTKEVFASVVKQMAPRLKAGYNTTYFGDLKKSDFRVHIWKLEFADKGDDVLAEVSTKDKKVGGFFLR